MIIKVPDAVLTAKSLRSPERAVQFIKLCASVAASDGTYHARGVPAALKKGQVIFSRDDLGDLWGITRSSARRSIEAMERDALVRSEPAENAAIPGEQEPAGTLITVIGLE